MNTKRLLLTALFLSPLFLGDTTQADVTPATADIQMSLSVETGRSKNNRFVLSGRDSGQQLLITGSTGDLTSKVSYEANPKGIVNITPTGY